MGMTSTLRIYNDHFGLSERPFTLRLGWEHPVRWRLLRSEFVALTLDGTTVGLVRYDVDSGLFYVWDSERGVFGSRGRAGQSKRLRAGESLADMTNAHKKIADALAAQH